MSRSSFVTRSDIRYKTSEEVIQRVEY